jgi:hypothetical protein
MLADVIEAKIRKNSQNWTAFLYDQGSGQDPPDKSGYATNRNSLNSS